MNLVSKAHGPRVKPSVYCGLLIGNQFIQYGKSIHKGQQHVIRYLVAIKAEVAIQLSFSPIVRQGWTYKYRL